MRHLVKALIGTLSLSLCAAAFGQFAPTDTPQTFHVRGTVADLNGAVIPGVEITFNSEQLTRTTTTNAAGEYGVDLPLGGYTMKAERQNFRTYRRPLFLVMSSASISFDINLPVKATVDRRVVKPSGEPMSAEDWKALGKVPLNYYGEEFLQLPSKNGVPFQLYVRYIRRVSTDAAIDYSGERSGYNQEPVFAAYNLFSLRADHLVFNVKAKTIEASGDVVISDENGMSRRANSIALKIENGHVMPLP